VLPDFTDSITLHTAIKSLAGTTDCILAILTHCPDAARIHNETRPSLHFAIRHGSSLASGEGIVESLSASDIGEICTGPTSYCQGCRSTSLEIVEALLEANPEVQGGRQGEQFPLHLGMKKGPKAEVIRSSAKRSSSRQETGSQIVDTTAL
jgi:hypothetical protein